METRCDGRDAGLAFIGFRFSVGARRFAAGCGHWRYFWGVAFAINSGAGAETALLLGFAYRDTGVNCENIYNGMFIPLLCHKTDAYAEMGIPGH